VALTSYAELQTALGVELNRTDLTAVIPDLITRFEARARRELRDWLRTTVSLTNVTGDTVLAATVSDVLSVSYHDGANGAHNFALDLLTKEAYQTFLEAQSALVSTAGQAVYVDADIDAGTTTLRFWPPAGASAPIANLQVEVIKVLPALATAGTNALLRDAPDIYLNGSCAEAAKYLAHDERVALWASERDQGFKALRILTERRLYGGAPRRRVLPVVFG
jgi:hypothetical protein